MENDEAITDKQKVADMMGIEEDEVTDDIAAKYDFDEPKDAPPADELDKDTPPADVNELDFDPLAVYADTESEYHSITKHIVDSLGKSDPVGDKNHPYHKVVSDNKHRYDELKEKMDSDGVDWEIQRSLQDTGLREVATEDGQTVIFDDENDPRIGMYGGETYDDAVDNETVDKWNESQYDYLDRKKEYINKKGQADSVRENRKRQAEEAAKNYQAEREEFVKSHKASEEYIVSIEEKYSNNFNLTFEQAHMLEMADKAGGVDKFLKNINLDQGIDDLLEKPDGVKNKPISNSDGSKDLGGGKDIFTPASALEIQGMSDPEFIAYNREHEQAIKDGKIKKR